MQNSILDESEPQAIVTNCIHSPSKITFGDFACDDALGVMLAHTLTVGTRKFKKGRILNSEDIAALKQAGIDTVSGAQLQADDVPEDSAAAAVAKLLAGANTEARKPYSGRCNLHSLVHGVVVMNGDDIVKTNRIDEAIAIGTLPPWSVVRKGQVIATVKIIPFGVNRHVMEAYRAALTHPPLRVAELKPHRTALICTELPDLKDSSLLATTFATRQRLESLGSRLTLELRCPHEPQAIAFRLRQARAAGCELILISGAASTKDRNDTVPAAIVGAGGEIERFGIPVEPGNMLLLARLDSIPVLILPGCARSRRLNGLDRILHRLLAKLPLNDSEFAAMGIGGLIRNAPAETDDDEVLPTPASTNECGPRIAALVLAAGQSSRMGGSNKLLKFIAGVPLALRAVNAALASRAASVTVVSGSAKEEVESLVGGPGVAIVHNPEFAAGMSSSLRRGISALPADSDGVLVMLGDMPYINATHLDRLIAAFVSATNIIVPMHGGRRGNPILWPRNYFSEIQAIEGDQGARDLLMRHADHVVAIEMADQAIFMDVDTPQDLVDEEASSNK